MTMAQRLAIAVGALLLLGGALATLLPTSPQGATCGTWVSPEWTDDEVAYLSGASNTADDLRALGMDEEAAKADGIAYTAVAVKRTCDDALSTRRTVSIVLLLLGVAVPAAVLFVGGRRNDDELVDL